MINKSNHEFTDISSEQFRVYVFENGTEVRIEGPLYLSVARSGGHRVFSDNDVSHYIPSGWVHLWWKVKEGQPNFVK